MNNEAITIRPATEADARAVLQLAALDSAEVPAGELLLAERDGRLVAALPVNGGTPVADPFERTAAVLELLRLQAAQLHEEGRPRGRRLHPATAI